jgi:diaminopimelate epimerase
MISFIKYHGTGNDFIMIDDRATNMNLGTEKIRLMCHRHFGIGADGLIQIREKQGYDFDMLYFNSDGLPGSMCGNGGRCSVAFAKSLGLIKTTARFNAFDGPHEAKIISDNPTVVSLHMNDLSSIEVNSAFTLLNTGSPHYVTFTDHVEELDVVNEGRKIRYADRFVKEGTNVNFVELKDDCLYVRTYERGVEAETLSCGTGVTASVLAAAKKGLIKKSPYNVITPGGRLTVHFIKKDSSFTDIWLEGETTVVFSGTF